MSKIIPFDTIVAAVAELCGKAAIELPADVEAALSASAERETSPTAREFFRQYLENARIASDSRMPLCQDTGFAVFFVEMGDEVRLDHGLIYEAINAGVRQGYKQYYLRKSIDSEPIFHRVNTTDNTPAIVNLEIVPGNQLRLILAPKGGGSENMSALKMLRPADGRRGVIDFVVDSVTRAGGNPCPPTVVGVGVGGTIEKTTLLAKKALLRPLGQPNPNPDYAELEREILARLNASGVGAQGLGGDVTALAVHIEYFPCHLASLPVAVALNCHAARHAEVTL